MVACDGAGPRRSLALEPRRYAGSIGYLDVTGNLDLSVVIRTVIVADHRVMVQFGGGIVADSEPASEWLETVAKGVRLTGVLDRHLRASTAQVACRIDEATAPRVSA
jgi:anthranilate/para-aminobenzoate synthase component I